MSKLFQGFDPVRSCRDCENYIYQNKAHWCDKKWMPTERPRLIGTDKEDCFEERSKWSKAS